MSLELTYLGSAGVKLRRLIQLQHPGPADGNINTRRPFPKFGQFQNMNAMSHSSYHGQQARLQRRFSRGLTLLASYSYSKSIDFRAAASGQLMAISSRQAIPTGSIGNAGCRHSTSGSGSPRPGCQACHWAGANVTLAAEAWRLRSSAIGR